MVIPVAKPEDQHVRRMLPHGGHYINQRRCHCDKRAIKLRRKVVTLFYLGNVVVSRLYFLRLLLGWCSCYVCFMLLYFFLGVKAHDSSLGSHIRITLWIQ